MSAYLRSIDEVRALLGAQRQAYDREGPVDAATRRRRLQAVIELLVAEQNRLLEAMDADFGGRHPGYSLMTDVLGALSSLKHARSHFEQWMQDSPRPPFAPYDQLGAEAWVQYRPKGSVGIIGTWNAPVFTLLSPLAGVLAAGNRAILKPSEIVPNTAQVLAEAIADRFDPLELAIVTGGVEVGQGFASQPFDHLVFTGGTSIGRDVMRRAAENLVPVTLELGGKSPAIVGRSADIADAARRLAIAKFTNGGQICVSPDLVYVPVEQKQAFIGALRDAVGVLYPRAAGNPDLVAVVNERHLQRIDRYLADAEAQGAEIIRCPDEAPVPGCCKRPLSVVVNPPLHSLVMQEEIFGPAMVLLTYSDLPAVVEEINSRPRPLALYYFGHDQAEQDYVLGHTLSGGVTINDAMMHPAMHDAPFGGVGASGMGHYHGWEGFCQFSHARTIFKAPAYDPRGEWGLLPPYGENLLATLQAQVTAD
ncbi:MULTISPECIES: coniferyl aldehyde dehydrogenase [Pseudomonadaceae]|uniref:coniferyl aldehyde dehydrogenase n=1 Tax=Pseudomonadaceae TaxID=135621 RepID=UPI0015E3D146|nr:MULTISPECIES: coniferyl aldehyde dehydrogenase [Pseudomonadaceae]MBA1277525.1 coniferyl aldehyde dehydrogenase [Stutzerimonas stutzeri]MBC8651944.1 coniferyl aldehyde dehydrogenase [Pseudomonas sp. MT4]QXY91255.1 coniferyl aldehyde dehydrogenase [Pseudomonas sp. MTM4]